mgnify:FL=1
MIGAGAHLLLRWLALIVFLFCIPPARIGLAAWLLLGLKPGVLAAAAVTLLVRWRRCPDLGAQQAPAVLGGFVAVVGFYLVGPFGLNGWTGLVWGMVPALAVALTVGGLACRWSHRLPGSVLFVATLAAAAAFQAINEMSSTTINSLGLVSDEANSVKRSSPVPAPNKDNYPPCTFRYNSLGYRDDEPPTPRDGRRRILILGGSSIWGDGIPTNEETIGRLLAAELDRAALGRYVVMSAAYPGLRLYGFSRIIDTLAPLYRPEVVVIRYQGAADFIPVDPQFVRASSAIK